MMADIVVNASPLILLGKIGRLKLLNQLFRKVYVPRAVIHEIQVLDKTEMDLSELSFEQIDVSNRIAVHGLLGRMHIGEVEVIVGAIEKSVSTVILDENTARNKAKQMGLEVTGTLGILLKAFKQGLIEDIYPEIDKLKDIGMHLSDGIIDRIRKAL